MWDPLTRGYHGLSSEGEEEKEEGMDGGELESGPLSFFPSDLTPGPPEL